MMMLPQLLILNVFIPLAWSIKENELPVTNFISGNKFANINSDVTIKLPSDHNVFGSNDIREISVAPGGSITLQGTGVSYVIQVYDGFGGVPPAGGSVYYSVVDDPTSVTTLTGSFPASYEKEVNTQIGFDPVWVLVVTWHKVKFSPTTAVPKVIENTFQLVLLTDKTSTSLLMAYVGPLTWNKVTHVYSRFHDTNNNVYKLPGSSTRDVVRLAKDSNFPSNGVTGLWFFNLDYPIQDSKKEFNIIQSLCLSDADCYEDLVCRDRILRFGRCKCPESEPLLVNGTSSQCKAPTTTTTTTTTQPTTQMSSTKEPESDDGNGLMILGIVIGCVCAASLAACAVCYAKRKKNKRESEGTSSGLTVSSESDQETMQKDKKHLKSESSGSTSQSGTKSYSTSVDSYSKSSSKDSSSTNDTFSVEGTSSSGGTRPSEGTSSMGTSSKGTSGKTGSSSTGASSEYSSSTFASEETPLKRILSQPHMDAATAHKLAKWLKFDQK